MSLFGSLSLFSIPARFPNSWHVLYSSLFIWAWATLPLLLRPPSSIISFTGQPVNSPPLGLLIHLTFSLWCSALWGRCALGMHLSVLFTRMIETMHSSVTQWICVQNCMLHMGLYQTYKVCICCIFVSFLNDILSVSYFVFVSCKH